MEESKAIDGKSIILIRQASNTGQLYGSVATRDLAEALTADGAQGHRNQVVLDKPIKALGVYEVKIALHPEVSVTVKVNIARSPEEAELQAKGVNVSADMFERDNAGFTEAFDPNAEPGTLPADMADAPADAAAGAKPVDRRHEKAALRGRRGLFCPYPKWAGNTQIARLLVRLSSASSLEVASMASIRSSWSVAAGAFRSSRSESVLDVRVR